MLLVRALVGGRGPTAARLPTPCALSSADAMARRLCCRRLCTVTHDPPAAALRLYRFSHIHLLRAALRVKVLQLGVGVGVLTPTASLMASGAGISLVEGATLAAIVGGTLAAGSTLSWYCERLVGELSWLPATQVLRVSTLTMWGHRKDRDFPASELLANGYTASPVGPSTYPATVFVPLDLGGKTYIFIWGRRHVLQLEALANLLARQALPCPLSPTPPT